MSKRKKRKENKNKKYKNKLTGIAILVEETGDLYETRTQCAKALGVQVSSVSQCLSGKTHTCAGYHLKIIPHIFDHKLNDEIIKKLDEIYGEKMNWRDHPTRPNVYVSDSGAVAKNIRGRVVKRDHHEINSGYVTVSIGDNYTDESNNPLVHILVAETFIPNDDPINKTDVNHKDANKLNNNAWNLEWTTKTDNMIHAYNMFCLSGERVLVLETGEIFDTLTECAKAIGGTVSGLHDCETGRQKQHRGYHFAFLGGGNVDIVNKFPGYTFEYSDKDNKYHNMYRGTDLGFGGYIYGEPNMYGNVALLDIQSMHPSSIIAMNYFGEYTKNFKELLDARIAIKHGDYDTARQMMGGKLAPFLTDEKSAKELSNALKTCLNSSYGLTSAKFENPLRDNRNKNNIVALRGALFMRTLQDEVSQRGFTVASIRTDSIKIPDATPEIINFCMDFAKKYGYTFEHEATYQKMCLVNKSAYIAKYATEEECMKLYGYVPGDNKKHPGEWTATAKQFQVPYVFKTLFTKEPVTFKDMCEVFEVSKGGALYLDMNEALPDPEPYEKELEKTEDKYKKGKISDTTFERTCEELNGKISSGHDYHFVGKIGQFTPVKNGTGGGYLLVKRNEKYDSATGAKGYRWKESEVVKLLNQQDSVDLSYYKKLVDEAINDINQFTDFEWFSSDDPYIPKEKDDLPDFMNIPEDAPEELPWD